MENEKFSFSIGLDNQKALALFGCPVFSGHHFSFSGLTFWNEARSQYPTKFNKTLLRHKAHKIQSEVLFFSHFIVSNYNFIV